MKNLPDKIYLNLSNLTEEEYNELDFNELSEVTWSEDDVQGTNIEYVRKDAFIEKALKFIKTNVDRIVNNQHGVCMGCMDVDFRKYMEGE